MAELRDHRVGVGDLAVQHGLLDDDDEPVPLLVDDPGGRGLRTVVGGQVVDTGGDAEDGARIASVCSRPGSRVDEYSRKLSVTRKASTRLPWMYRSRARTWARQRLYIDSALMGKRWHTYSRTSW